MCKQNGRLCSACFTQTIVRFPKRFLPIGSNFLPVQSKEDHFWIKYRHSTPKLPFLIFVFILGSSNKMKVLPCNMVDILYSFCDCSVYNFISLFFFYWVMCHNEYTFLLMQQLDYVIIITSEYFNFKRKFKWKFPAVRNR